MTYEHALPYTGLFLRPLFQLSVSVQARAKLVQNIPSCLTMSIPAASVRLQTFVEVAVAQEDLDLIFKKRPYVWRTSEKSMRHSASYLRNNLGFDAEELRLLVLRDPLIISFTQVNIIYPPLCILARGFGTLTDFCLFCLDSWQAMLTGTCSTDLMPCCRTSWLIPRHFCWALDFLTANSKWQYGDFLQYFI